MPLTPSRPRAAPAPGRDGLRLLGTLVAGVAALAVLGFGLACLVLLDAAKGDILRSLRLSPERVDLVDQLRAQEQAGARAADVGLGLGSGLDSDSGSGSGSGSPDQVQAAVWQLLANQRATQVGLTSGQDLAS
jgi:hypothetical protein